MRTTDKKKTFSRPTAMSMWGGTQPVPDRPFHNDDCGCDGQSEPASSFGSSLSSCSLLNNHSTPSSRGAVGVMGVRSGTDSGEVNRAQLSRGVLSEGENMGKESPVVGICPKADKMSEEQHRREASKHLPANGNGIGGV